MDAKELAKEYYQLWLHNVSTEFDYTKLKKLDNIHTMKFLNELINLAQTDAMKSQAESDYRYYND